MITSHWPNTSVHSKQVLSEERTKDGKQKRNAKAWTEKAQQISNIHLIDRLTDDNLYNTRYKECL